MPATADIPGMTPADATPSNPGTITNLISGILDDGKTLARQQMEMFKSEVREDLRKTMHAGLYGGLGMVTLVVGAFGLIHVFVQVLHEVAHLPEWASWGIVSLAFIGFGAAMLLASSRIFKSFNPLPDKTLHAAQETLTWNKK